MKTALNGSNTLVKERFPELSFLLQITQEEPFSFCEGGANGQRGAFFLHRPQDLSGEIDKVLAPLQLDKIEVLYIYGAGLGYYGASLLEWLNADSQRDLVFLEDDIEALRLFFDAEHAAHLLSHPQVHLRFLPDSKKWKVFLDECARDFPYECVELIALESYQKNRGKHVKAMRLHLMRRSTVHHAIHIEERFHHLFFKNVFPNFRRLETAFYANHFKDQFKGIPAVICGAGPSLKDEIETMRELDSKALIIAGGSAIAGLGHAGILPHLGVAIDPNFEEYERFKFSSAFEVPLFYTSRLHPRVFETCNGPHGYIRALTGGEVEAWLESEVGIEEIPLQGGFDIEALSVTTTAIELAVTMGCSPIILAGVDLAFTNDQTYADGIVGQNSMLLSKQSEDLRASERLLKRKDRLGKPVYTLVKWIMESSAISRFAKKNRKVAFFSATSGGIGFQGIPYRSLKEFSFPLSTDLRGKIHHLIEMCHLQIAKGKLEGACAKLSASLCAASKLIERALEELERIKGEDKDPETGRLIFYQMELEELEAYRCFLHIPSFSFPKVFLRKHRFPSWNAAESEKNEQKWKFLHAKWITFKDLVNFHLEDPFTK